MCVRKINSFIYFSRYCKWKFKFDNCTYPSAERREDLVNLAYSRLSLALQNGA